MKRSLLFASLLFACGNKDAKAPEAPAPAAPPPASQNTVAEKIDEIDAFLKDDSAALSPEMEEKLLLALKECKLTDYGIDGNCQQMKNWNKSRNKKTLGKALLGGSSGTGEKHIGDESPAIRLKSAELMGSIFGSNKNAQAVLIAAAEKEKEPVVLSSMIRQVGSSHKGSPEVKALLLKMADHEAEKVRIESMSWFLTSFGEGVPETWAKVEEHLMKDTSNKVRAYLCSRLYGSSNEKAIGHFAKLLSDKKTPQEVYDGCFTGVINAWTGFPFPANPNKKAYELTLKALQKKPRSETNPPWGSISTLRASKTEFKPDDSFGTKWFEKVKPWYKKDQLTKALEDIAMDSQAGWIARGSSVDTLKELGHPKAAFEKMEKKLKDAGTDGMVKKKVQDLLKTL